MTNQEAIENLKALQGLAEWVFPMDFAAALDVAIEALQNFPTEVSGTSADDLISRKAAIDAIISESTADGAYGYVDTKSIMNLINKLTSAQQKLQWIPVKAHSATDEEKENCPSIDYWFDCPMPNDDQEILVTVRHKNYLSVEKDVCYVEDTIGLDSGYDWLTDVIAWMPLPEPYREEVENENNKTALDSSRGTIPQS